MTNPQSASRAGSLQILLGLFLSVACIPLLLAANNGSTKHFALEPGSAAHTLKQFAEQSGRAVAFVSASVANVETTAVQGELTPAEALRRMLAGTVLVAEEDVRTGGFAVRRGAADPNGERTGPVAAPTSRPNPARAPGEDDPVVLSPFEVVADARGYQATNTMSGTRLNTRLEDIAASISVVTKEQMEDFGLLDINDIFAYETNTEGTGNYTAFEFNQSGMPIDGVQDDPQTANRIRGLNTANVSFGNFETSGTTPLDPTNIDAVEISRGPNSSLFGIGNPAGTVNAVPASANLRRNTATSSVRGDTRDGWRFSLDGNRVLKRDVLAVRGSFVRQHDGFELKPSGVDTIRLNGMVKYRPFQRTTLSVSHSFYEGKGKRPNAITPRDGVSGWLAAGAPTWDPVAMTAKINGVVVGTFPAAANPAYFTPALGGGFQGFIDQRGLDFLTTFRGSPGNTPLTQNQNQRLMEPVADPTGFLASQPMFQNFPALSDKSIMDWSKVNIAAMNYFRDETRITTALLEQMVLDTGRHTLGLQVGWFRENADRYNRNIMGGNSFALGTANQVMIDVNERLLDGTSNPYFLHPYVRLLGPQTWLQENERDTYRGQIAYRLDLRNESGWMKWLGQHSVSGYYEYKSFKNYRIALRDAVVSDHAWSSPTAVRGAQGPGYMLFHRFYVGDNQGYNVDKAPTPITAGTFPLRWGNAVTQQFTTENVAIDTVVDGSNTGGQRNSWTVLKSEGAILQSFLLKDRLVTTFGIREDQRYSKRGANPRMLDGTNLDYDSFHQWRDEDWQLGEGMTRTAGVVAKPLPWLHLFANQSNSFNPTEIAYGMYRHLLPDPSGKGKDYGVAFNLFQNRLTLRINRYKTTQINTRNGASGGIAQRAYRLDFANTTGRADNLQRQATLWITEQAAAQGITLTPAQLNQRLADTMKLPLEFVEENPPNATAADDVTARGTEVEVHFNPTNYWTLKVTMAEQESINSALAAEATQWIEERLAVWPTIIDPRVGRPWWTESYGNAQQARQFYLTQVFAPLSIAKAFEGRSRPQVRRYRANFLTNLRLSGITDHRLLKRFSVGGALRWEDKAAIGFRGVQQPPAEVIALDPNRPINDKARAYYDAFISYRTRIFSDKVGLTLQLNGRNIFENGRLQGIAAEADGRISAFRIVDPRLFILTATFSM